MDQLTRVGGEAAYHLQHAILVYGDGRRSFATLHEPIAAEKGGAPHIGAGRPVSVAFLKALAGNLGHGLPAEILPPHVLVRTADVLLWWRPRSVAGLFYNVARVKSLTTLARTHGKPVPHPALLFRATKGELWVRALADNQRPTATTPLYQAPYFNVGLSGSVCVGTMRRPTSRGVDVIAQWEAAFFGSEFTHQLPGTTLSRHPKGFAAMWAHLAKSKASSFPSRWLAAAPKKQTAHAFIETKAGGDW